MAVILVALDLVQVIWAPFLLVWKISALYAVGVYLYVSYRMILEAGQGLPRRKWKARLKAFVFMALLGVLLFGPAVLASHSG